MGKLKKFSNWFFQTDKNYDQDKNGERLYYPWGKPGEAYYLTKKQEVIFQVIGFTCLYLILFGAFYLLYYTCVSCRGPNVFAPIFISLVAMIFVCYFFLCNFYLHKSRKAYVLPLENRPERKINKFYIWFMIVFAILMGVFAAFYIMWYPDEYALFFFMLVESFFMIGVVCIIFILKKTKGYIFNK